MNEEVLFAAENVCLTIDGVDIIKNFTFNVHAGENIIFFGPENSGIEELLKIFFGFIVPNEGKVIFKGRDISEFNYIESHDFKREIGYVSPAHGLISNMSVEMNIALPLQYHSSYSSAEIRHKVDHIIDILNISSCKNLRPIKLSSSESVRTAYGRAIALNPDLLFLENIFEGQSPLNVNILKSHIYEHSLNKDKSMIVVTYRPEEFVSIRGRYIMLFKGEIVFDGSIEAFLMSQNEYLVQYRSKSSLGPMEIN